VTLSQSRQRARGPSSVPSDVWRVRPHELGSGGRHSGMARTAVIAGVGPGLGASIARKFVAEGCQVGLFARSTEYVDELAAELGEDALAVPTDSDSSRSSSAAL